MPAARLLNTAACTRGPQIGGVEKQAAPTNAGFDVATGSSMTSVDGYTAIPDTDVAWGVSSTFCQKANPSGVCNNLGSYVRGWPVGGFDGTSYLPIVQGNYSGWDTYLHVTNAVTRDGNKPTRQRRSRRAPLGQPGELSCSDSLTPYPYGALSQIIGTEDSMRTGRGTERPGRGEPRVS